MGELDHWIWTVPNLATGASSIQGCLGATYFGGRHEGLGSANHILPLNNQTFLEVLGPSGESGLLAPKLKASQPRIATFAVRTGSLEGIADMAIDLGLRAKGPQGFTRLQSDGTPLRWRLLQIHGHDFGDYLPFFIDWGSSPHPSIAMPSHVSVESFLVSHASAKLASIYDSLGIPVTVQQGPSRMVLTLRSERGEVVLEGRGNSDLLTEEW